VREKMEDLISEWDLMDVKPIKVKYTWSNKRSGPIFIASCLDHFLIHINVFLLPFSISSQILPYVVSYHRPISYYFDSPINLGTIPFRFNPLWLHNNEVFSLVKQVWATYILGSPNYIWERKLRVVKLALKSWEKSSFVPPFPMQGGYD
jgi:hypothetical protein